VVESTPLIPASRYGESKRIAENMVAGYARLGLPFTIIRPCIMYGPRDRHFLPLAIRLAHIPLLPLIDGGRHSLDLVYVEDVVELIWRSSIASAAAGKIYNSASGAAQPLRSLFEDFHSLGGPIPVIWPVSKRVFRTMAPLLRIALRLFVPGLASLASPVGMLYMDRDIVYELAAARRDLGYAPRTTFRDGLARSLEKSGKRFLVRQ
jgi:nucleoside-diphosphate-sugar epimerase